MRRYSVEGGLLRSDLSPKPAYLALQNLIHQEWNTREELVSDQEGIFHFRGFDGTYEIVVNGKRYFLHLNEEEPEKVLYI